MPVERVFLSIGSNLGDRLAHIKFAHGRLAEIPFISSLKISPIYETDPWGLREQPPFLNCIVRLKCELTPEKLLEIVKMIEAEAGREVPAKRWGPRTLDVDILLFGDRRIRTPDLIVPHPQLIRRRFVLQPLAELAAELDIPGTQLTVGEALRKCRDRGEVRLYTQLGEA